MKKIVVDKKYDNKKLSRVILEKDENIHYPLFCRLLRKKDIKINGKRVNKDILVHEKDEIVIYIQGEKEEIQIAYEDDNILIVNKQAGMEVTGNDSLTQRLQMLYKGRKERIMPCHRIDRNTMGLVLFAKSEEVLQILLEKFKQHEIEKHYLALVYGIPKEEKKRAEAYLFKDQKKAKVYIKEQFEKGYQKIITFYTILEKREDNTALLDVCIETGKTHQIRAHLAYLGFPIVGDGKYGKNEINKKYNKKTQVLYSYSLKFNFVSPSGVLEYLKGKEIKIDEEI